MKDINDLIAKVHESHKKIPRQTLDSVFMTLQDVMIKKMGQGGDITCKLGHQGKGTRKQTPALPCLVCSQEVTETGQHVVGGPCMCVPVPTSPPLRRDNEEDGHAEQSLMTI